MYRTVPTGSLLENTTVLKRGSDVQNVKVTDIYRTSFFYVFTRDKHHISPAIQINKHVQMVPYRTVHKIIQ